VPGKPCIAVVSPFLSRRHGTERCTVEQVERLSRDYGYEVHLFCQRLEDLENAEPWSSSAASQAPGHIFWHRVSAIPGPHLLQFFWWMAANRFRRWRDARSGRLRFDVVYSPGINCLDADAVTVHVVFHELVPGGGNGIFKMGFSLRVWLRRVHRLLYYRLLMNLENEVYKKPHLAIAAVSRKTASEIERHFGRKDVRVIHNGVDLAVFNPKARLSRRVEARQRFAFGENEFVVLLIGNDWNSKGLPALLQAAAACAALPLQLLVVGEGDRAAFRGALERLALASRVRFEAPAADVMQFYAAADLYVSPSLHDSFALPVAEAMACALPVVTSAQAGISALLHHGVDSFILRNPRDAGELARLLRRLYEDSGLRQTLGENAARAAQGLTWGKNAALTRDFLEAAMLARDTRKSSGIL